MTSGRDAFKRRSAKVISWSLIEQSITPALMTCLACEVRITSIRELDESVTLVGEAINCDRLNDSQKNETSRSQNHQQGSDEINKISLSCFADKRYIHKMV